MLTIVVTAAAGFAMAFAYPLLEHGHTAFHRFRLRRRLARDPYILREEYREYQYAIGGEGPALGPVVWTGTVAALSFGVTAWATNLGMEHVFEAGMALVGMALAARSLWRLLNDPDDVDPDEVDLEGETRSPGQLRRDAWLGLGSAGVVLAIAAWQAGWL